MQVKSIAECSKGEHSAILLTFIKLPFVIKIFVLSIFEWLLKTGFTVVFTGFRSARKPDLNSAEKTSFGILKSFGRCFLLYIVFHSYRMNQFYNEFAPLDRLEIRC